MSVVRKTLIIIIFIRKTLIIIIIYLFLKIVINYYRDFFLTKLKRVKNTYFSTHSSISVKKHSSIIQKKLLYQQTFLLIKIFIHPIKSCESHINLIDLYEF
jgi:hypothetical protein